MAMTSGGMGEGPQSDINMTPMIDVLLVLLIIFLVIQPAMQRGVRVEVPAVRQAEAREQPEQVVLRVEAGPTYEINGQPVALEEIAPALNGLLEGRRSDERIVFLDGAETLTYGHIVRAIDEARRVAELQSIALIPRSQAGRFGGQ